MYPRQSPTTHTEQLGDEASIYDWARAQVHALNPTAARVWRLCDGATSPGAIAAALRVEIGVPEADAVVNLTLAQLTSLHLLELPVESRSDPPATARRWLLGRGVAAAMLPAIYSIVAPSAVEAQSPGPGAPTLTSLSPNQGARGTTVAVTLTGTNLVAGATTVTVSGGGVTVANVTVSGATSLTAALITPPSLTANFVIDPTAAEGPRTVTVTTALGTSSALTFTIGPLPGAPTLTGVAPNQGVRGTTVAVTLTGTNFVVGAATVAVSGSGVTATDVTVGSSTSLTANFVLDPAAATGARTVTVTTAGGTSGPQEFTISVPPGPPIVSVTASASPVAGTATTFSISAAPAAGTNATIQNVQVTFGDGTAPVNLGAVSGTATTQHVFAAAGTYTVSATATDTGGRTSTATIQMVVAPAGPTVSVTASANPVSGIATTFTIGAAPATGSATIQNVRVTFGDGTAPVDLGAVSGTTTTQHVYAAAGTYTVSATATDSDGRTSTAAIQVVVAPRGLPTVSVTASASPVAGTATTFTISAAPATGSSATILNVQVTFGDGTAPVDLGVVSGTTTTQHVYAAAGTYTVAATATDSDGRTSTATIQVVVAAV